MAAAKTEEGVLVIGATGLIGVFITRALIGSLKAGEFKRLGVFTSQKTVTEKADLIEDWKSNGLEIFVGSLDDEKDVLAAYEGFDTIVSALGRGALEKQIPLLRLAEATPSITRFFPSEYGTDIEYFPESVHEKPHQNKLKVRAYIRESVKRVQHSYLVTGPFADGYLSKPRVEPRVGGFDVKGKKAWLLGTPEGKISLTTNEDVGKLLAAAIRHPEVAQGKALKVNSFTAIQAEILTEFERQTGAKWESEYTSVEVLQKIEQVAYDAGHPFAVGVTLRRIWTQGGTLYEKRDNEDMGVTDTDTLEVAVRRAIAEQS
ncbi:putative isoflavone reductase family protein [Trichodelitschia bisporula]|uniref:Putative isoflavone reductase family protein n=1 Tax=Trichodelitschia bisporula TaxID=703511 RepID=A0A6G1HVP7_9PEZI|nr:putative isoflavone reductase family protein [Trichodelitschia bisporula]